MVCKREAEWLVIYVPNSGYQCQIPTGGKRNPQSKLKTAIKFYGEAETRIPAYIHMYKFEQDCNSESQDEFKVVPMGPKL